MVNELYPNSEILRDVQILVVDNDLDSRDLCADLFESYGAKVTTIESIKDALAFLDWFTADLLICETNFFGETVYPLIERVRSVALSSSKTIPILITSTFHPICFAQYLAVGAEAYLRKPIDIYDFVDEVWTLIRVPSIVHPTSIQDWTAIAKCRQSGALTC